MAGGSVAVTALMVLVAAAIGNRLPGPVPLPTHWNIHGQPDAFSDKWTALLMPVLIAGATSLIFYFLPVLEPRKEHLKQSQGLVFSAWAVLLLMSILVQFAVVSVALHWSVHGTSFILAGVGLTFAVIGNQLGKSRSMFLVGIRTPWTLSSEEVWIRTHRLAGKLMVAGGLLLTATAFLPLPNGMTATVMGAVIAASVIVPIVYSYILWRREQGSGHANG